MKKLTCFILCLTLLLTSSPLIMATDNPNVVDTFSFIDAVGQVNRIDTIINNDDSIEIHLFVENVLISKSVTYKSNNELLCVTTDQDNVITDSTTLPLENINTIPGDSTKSISPYAPKYYMGQIYYNPCYDDWGNAVASNLNLGIYQRKNNTYDTYRDLNYMKGTAVNHIIGIVAAVVSAIAPNPFTGATAAVYAILSYAGVTVVGGVIQASISETYYIREEEYIMYARDPATSREFSNYGYCYQILVDDIPMGEDHFDGYYPWNDTYVAYWWFTEFWDYNYPGVNRIV